MSQTLKALERKSYVSEVRSEMDKWSISYDLTPEGVMAIAKSGALEDLIHALPAQDKALLEDALSSAHLALAARAAVGLLGYAKNAGIIVTKQEPHTLVFSNWSLRYRHRLQFERER